MSVKTYLVRLIRDIEHKMDEPDNELITFMEKSFIQNDITND